MRKLLVIDDNLGFLGFLTSALEKYFEVYTATGVKDALRLLEHQKVEAICSDYNMRDGTGLDLLEEIRQKGYAISYGETIEGACGIAAPIFDQDGIIASLMIYLPVYRLNDQTRASHLKHLLEASEQISKCFSIGKEFREKFGKE